MKTTRAKHGVYAPGSKAGFSVQIKDRKVLNILQDNKNHGIPHTSTAELSISSYLGVEFKRRRGARRQLHNFDYNRKTGVIVAIKAGELINALISLRESQGISPAYTVEQAILKHYPEVKAL